MKTETVLVNGDFQVHKAGCRDVGKALAESDYTKPIEHDSKTEEEIVRDLWSDIIGDYGKTADEVDVAFMHEHGLVTATHFYPCTAKGRDKLVPVPDGEATPDADARYTVVGPDAKGKFYVHDAETADITGPSYKTATEAETAIARLTSVQGKAEESVLDGVKVQRSGRAPRTTRRSPKPGVTKTVPTPKTSTNGSADSKRDAKQALARGVVMRAVTGVKLSPEDQATVAAWVHHLPTGRDEQGRRWWPEGFVRPDRSDWR
jgi:hypothetical protein